MRKSFTHVSTKISVDGAAPRQLTNWLRLFALAIALCMALTLQTNSAYGQDGSNWLQTIVDEQLSVDRLVGGTPFLPYPVLHATFTNQLEQGYNVYPVSGDLLRPADAGSGYCTLVLAGSNEPITIPPARGSVDVEIVAFCIELPDDVNGKKPDEFANYLPINYAGQTTEEVRLVLQRAREGNLAREFATQVAVWSANTGLPVSEIGNRIGEDLTPFMPLLTYLLEGGPLPAVDATVEEVVPEVAPEVVVEEPAVVAESENIEQTEAEDVAAPVAEVEIEPNVEAEVAPVAEAVPTESAESALPFGLSRTMLMAIAAGLGLIFLALLGFLGLMAQRRRTAERLRMKRSRRPRKKHETHAAEEERVLQARGAQPVASNNGEVAVAEASNLNGKVKCLICGDGHDTRECPNIQRPNQVFVPTEVELTLANVEENVAARGEAGPAVPEIEAFWNRHANGNGNGDDEPDDGTQFLQPFEAPNLDDEFYNAAKIKARPADDDEIHVDTSGVLEAEEDDVTGPTSRKHVTYVVREKGRPEIIGSLGDDGGIVSRISLKDQQILLPPKDVSTPHAILRMRPDGRVTIKDLNSKNGTYLYEDRIEAGVPTPLHDGAQIRFGDSAEFELDLHSRKLVSLNNNTISRDLSSSEQWLITRRNLHTIVIRNNQISTPHLLIRPSDEDVSEIKLKDLSSHNPTFVDDALVELSTQENGLYVKPEKVDFRVGDKVYTIQARNQNTPDKIGDNYSVMRQIYISKMADVYQVQDNRSPNSGFQVAKLLNIYQEKKESALKAFNLEIELMQSIDNPHILPVIETGHDVPHDAPYYIMPFLEGSDMRRIMHQRRRDNDENAGLRLNDIQAIFNALLPALEAIHTVGYAHCDVKPANIYVTPTGEVYLLDLGVATPLDQHAEFFTQFYSAPEVGAKQLPPVSAASDVYSMAIVMFELITGMEAKDMVIQASDRSHENADTEQSRPNPNSRENLTRWLGETTYGLEFLEVLHKATQYLADQRYESIADFQAALEEVYQSDKIQQTLLEEGTEADLAVLSAQTTM